MNRPLPAFKASISRAVNSTGGQAMLKNLLSALDAMPYPRLIGGVFEFDCDYCAIGALGKAAGLNVAKFSTEKLPELAATFGCPLVLIDVIMKTNDEGRRELPAQKWSRMRDWTAHQIHKKGASA